MSPELAAYLDNVQHQTNLAFSMLTALDDLLADFDEQRDICLCLGSALREQLGKVANALDSVNLPKGCGHPTCSAEARA